MNLTKRIQGTHRAKNTGKLLEVKGLACDKFCGNSGITCKQFMLNNTGKNIVMKDPNKEISLLVAISQRFLYLLEKDNLGNIEKEGYESRLSKIIKRLESECSSFF